MHSCSQRRAAQDRQSLRNFAGTWWQPAHTSIAGCGQPGGRRCVVEFRRQEPLTARKLGQTRVDEMVSQMDRQHGATPARLVKPCGRALQVLRVAKDPRDQGMELSLGQGSETMGTTRLA